MNYKNNEKSKRILFIIFRIIFNDAFFGTNLGNKRQCVKPLGKNRKLNLNCLSIYSNQGSYVILFAFFSLSRGDSKKPYSLPTFKWELVCKNTDFLVHKIVVTNCSSSSIFDLLSLSFIFLFKMLFMPFHLLPLPFVHAVYTYLLRIDICGERSKTKDLLKSHAEDLTLLRYCRKVSQDKAKNVEQKKMTQ